jgi:uncharacterized protein YhdP
MYKKELGKPLIDQLCSEVGLEPNTRAETMEPAQHVTLANRFYQALNPDQIQVDQLTSTHEVELTQEEITALEQDDEEFFASET